MRLFEDRESILTSLMLILAILIVIAVRYYAYIVDGKEYIETEVTVKAGDTLWNIAEEHAPNQDARKTIHEIKQMNDIEGFIQPGDRLKVPQEVSRSKTITMEATAYTHTGNMTFTETWPEAGRTIAVDPTVIPLGSEVIIDGQTYIAEDTGLRNGEKAHTGYFRHVEGKRIDIFMDTEQEAIDFGRQQVEVRVIGNE